MDQSQGTPQRPRGEGHGGFPLPHIPGFQLLSEIGRGATSRVYRARQEALDREVAVKVITTLGERGRRRALRLYREARLAGALDHPGIVRGIDAGEEVDLCWFAMELVEGKSLQELVEAEGPLPLARVLEIARQLLEALDHAHRRGVIHRDIKPANVLLDAAGAVRLSDLGLARRERDPRLTEEGGSLGTPLYMAPEQARSPERVDARADLYGVAATLYYALCGVAPFQGETVAAVLTRVLYDEAVPPSVRVAGLSPAADLVVLRSLSKEPYQRHQSAQEFLEEVRALAAGTPLKRRLPGLRMRRRHRQLITLAAAAVLGGPILISLLLMRPPGGGPASTGEGRGQAPADASAPLRKELAGLLNEAPASGIRARELLEQCQRARQLLHELGLSDDPELAAGRQRLERCYLDAVGLLLQEEADQGAALLQEGEVDLASRRLGPDLAERIASLAGRPADPGLASAVQEEVDAVQAEFAGLVSRTQEEARQRVIQALRQFSAEGTSWETDPAQAEARVRDVVEAAGPYRLLSVESRREVAALERGAVERLLEAPRRWWDEALAAVEQQRSSRRYRSAKDILEASLARVRGVVPLAEDRAARELRRLEAEAEAEVSQAASVLEALRRPGAQGLMPSERQRRRELLAEGIRRLPADPAQVEGLQSIAARARALLAILDVALGLRAAALAAVDDLVNGEEVVLEPRLLGGLPLAPRRLAGREGNELLLVRLSDGFASAYAVNEVSGDTVAEVLRLGGTTPDPQAVALLLYLDGEDLEAQALAEGLLEGDQKDLLLDYARSGFEHQLRRFGTDEEREAFRALGQARLAAAAGRLQEAQETLEKVTSRPPRGGPVTAGWAELLRTRRALARELERRQRLLEAWRHLGPALGRTDPESGRIEARWALRAGTPLDGLTLPPHASPGEEGLEVRWPPDDAGRRPHEVSALLLKLPALEQADVLLDFEVLFPGPEAPAYLAVVVHDLCFLAVDTLRDAGAFQGHPLHGLERALDLPRVVQQAALWRGNLADFPGALTSAGKPLALPVGDWTPVSLRIRDKGRTAELRVGERTGHWELDPPLRLEGAGLRLAAYPWLRLRDLTLVVQGALEGSKR